MPNIIDCKKTAERLRSDNTTFVRGAREEDPKMGIPCLAILQVTGDPASDVYTRRKKEAVLAIGGTVRHILFNPDVEPHIVRRVINDLNSDPCVHGIMLQLPVPWSDTEMQKTLNAIVPIKDVDGLSKEAMSSLMEGEFQYHMPCTVRAVVGAINMLADNPFWNNVLIIGRSRLVGRPLATLLERVFDCTCTLAHSRTSQHTIDELSKNADVVVVATGTPRLIKLPSVNPAAIIVDVGINKDEEGTLCGDVDHSCLPQHTIVTASPGGVGLLTVEFLCVNLITAWKRQWKA